MCASGWAKSSPTAASPRSFASATASRSAWPPNWRASIRSPRRSGGPSCRRPPGRFVARSARRSARSTTPGACSRARKSRYSRTSCGSAGRSTATARRAGSSPTTWDSARPSRPDSFSPRSCRAAKSGDCWSSAPRRSSGSGSTACARCSTSAWPPTPPPPTRPRPTSGTRPRSSPRRCRRCDSTTADATTGCSLPSRGTWSSSTRPTT